MDKEQDSKLRSAQSLWNQGEKANALKQYESLAIVYATPQCIVEYAQKLYESNEYVKARFQLVKAIDKMNSDAFEKDPLTPKIRCLNLFLQGMIAKNGFKNNLDAIRFLEQAFKLAPEDEDDALRIKIQQNLKDISDDSRIEVEVHTESNKSEASTTQSQQNEDSTDIEDLEADPKRLAEAKEVKEMIDRMDSLVKPGSIWYILSMEWVKKWQNYTYFDHLSEDKPQKLSLQERLQHPGKLDNSSILQPLDSSTQITEQMKVRIWMNVHLKPSLKEGVDFMLVSPEIFNYVQIRYGCDPTQIIERRGIAVGDEYSDEGIVEYYFRPFKFCVIPNTATRFQNIKTLYLSRKEPVSELKKALQRAINQRLYQLKDKSMVVLMRLWRFDSTKQDQIEVIAKKYKNYTEVKIEGSCLNSRAEDENLIIEELDVAEEDLIIVELPKGKDTWTFAPDGEVQQIEQEEEAEAVSLQQLIGKDLKQVLKSNSRVGICGLQNLGNTCFMNSGLQCLSNTIELTKYFCFNQYKQDLNPQNPLGMGGKLAIAYAELIKDMWQGSSGRTAPHELKKVVGKRVTKFSGFGQQDSCELINYVLDLMHEDLNRVKKKPYVEMKDSEGRPDEIVSAEHWNAFIARNKSIIVDLMYGQLKSTVQCLECNNISITFDPFLTLSLPIAKPHKIRVIYVPYELFSGDSKLPCKVFSIAVDKETVEVMEQKVNELVSQQEESKEERHLMSVNFHLRTGTITTKFRKDQSCQDIDQGTEDTLIFEVRPPQKSEMENYKQVELIFMKQVKYGKIISGEHVGNTLPRMEYLPLNMTILQLKKMIYDKIKNIFKTSLDDQDINRFILLHVYDNLPMIQASKYSRKRATCEFCNDYHGQADTCDIKINKISGNSEDGAKQITIKDIFDQLQYKRDVIIGVIFREGSGAMMKQLDPELDQSHLKEMNKSKKETITLSECFKAYSREELLTGADQWYCNKCKEQRDIHKKLELFKVPKILIIQLKRFQSKRSASSSGKGGYMALAMAQVCHQEKVGDFVDFPVNSLDLRPYIKDTSSSEPVYYDLYAISNHYGSLNGGHYTAYGLNAVQNQWYEFNDSSVGRVSNVNEVVTSGAYLLFYRRRE